MIEISETGVVDRRAYHRDYYLRNRERALAADRAYYQTHRDTVLARQKAYYAANKERILARQRAAWDDEARSKGRMKARVRAGAAATAETRTGRCPICGRDGELVLDHDHATGLTRGWPCRRCNSGLGLLGDTPEALYNALAYLNAFYDAPPSPPEPELDIAPRP